MLFIFTRFL